MNLDWERTISAPPFFLPRDSDPAALPVRGTSLLACNIALALETYHQTIPSALILSYSSRLLPPNTTTLSPTPLSPGKEPFPFRDCCGQTLYAKPKAPDDAHEAPARAGRAWLRERRHTGACTCAQCIEVLDEVYTKGGVATLWLCRRQRI